MDYVSSPQEPQPSEPRVVIVSGPAQVTTDRPLGAGNALTFQTTVIIRSGPVSAFIRW
jgi:hypothetical protein